MFEISYHAHKDLNVLKTKCFVSTQIIYAHFIKRDMHGFWKDKNTIENRPAPLIT